jgi:lipoprotein-anchoring transpeptidase ErfK/SrfK
MLQPSTTLNFIWHFLFMNRFRSRLPFLASLVASLLVAAAGVSLAAAQGSETRILVSVADQKMVLLQDGAEVSRFPVSTSKFGLGDRWGSFATPLGTMQVARKIGDHAQEGAVFKERRLTGEVLPPNAPGRDPIVTRILWLRGLQPQNANCFKRCIYIHGTPEERLLGAPVSWGCIRMRSRDVVQVFETVDVGTTVEVFQKPLKVLLKEYAAMVRLAQVKGR